MKIQTCFALIKMNNRARGFSLVESLVTMTMLVMLIAMAIPSYLSFTIDTRMTAGANDFLTMLSFTRSEAVKRNTRVTLCKSSSGTACTTSGDWQQGWIVFVDAPTPDIGKVDGADTILRVQGALTGASTLVGTANVANYISYVSNGQSQLGNGAMQGGTLYLCSPDATAAGRHIELSSGTGRARIERDDAPATCS